jgi:hypothetical protein
MTNKFTELDRLSDEESNEIYQGILAFRRTRAGHALVQDSIEQLYVNRQKLLASSEATARRY